MKPSLLIHLLAASTFLGCPKSDELIVEVRNDLGFARTGEIVSISWLDIKNRLSDPEPTRMVIREEGSDSPLVVQLFDEDGDGAPDELLFQDNIPAHSKKRYTIGESRVGNVPPRSRTDARFVEPREDLAWENDRIAFRMYGPAMAQDVNSGIDVWTKRVRYLIVEKWYKGKEHSSSGKDSYHRDHGEGADFFAVGTSLGAGGSALWLGDSLLQSGVFSSYKIVATGPLRAVFMLSYPPVLVEGKPIRETKRIQLDAGSNLNRIEVVYEGSDSGKAVVIAAGVVKRGGVTAGIDREKGWVSLFGMTTGNDEDEFLGTGVVVPPVSVKDVMEDDLHTMVLCNATVGAPLVYYAGAGWTRSGDFAVRKDWEDYLSQFSERVTSPLIVVLNP